MRLRACLGGLVLGASACAQIPGEIRIDVDGSTLEFKKKPAPPAPAPASAPAPAPEPDAPTR